MNVKQRSLLFELSRNGRLTTQQLGKRIGTSQQSASYMKRQLEGKGTIKSYVALVDPSRLGHMNVLVGFNCLTFARANTEKTLRALQAEESIVSIQTGTRGIDFIVEYCEKNLSAFNKTHSKVVHSLSSLVMTKFVFPVVVKHRFCRNYLAKRPDDEDMIVCGDREPVTLSEQERRILQSILVEPGSSLSAIANTTGISLKSIIRMKKKLEQLKVITGYTCILDTASLEISRNAFFLELTGLGLGEINKLVEWCHSHHGVIEMVKLIGTYHVMLITEGIGETELLHALRSNFAISDYIVVPISGVEKESYAASVIERAAKPAPVQS